jgi:hypothetical protein
MHEDRHETLRSSGLSPTDACGEAKGTPAPRDEAPLAERGARRRSDPGAAGRGSLGLSLRASRG